MKLKMIIVTTGFVAFLGSSCDPRVELCDDGIDNDDDGLVDCEDPDCDDCPEGDTETDTDSDTDTDTDTALVDEDGDGFYSEASGGDDCDDGDPAINPSADEACDGVDDDCDGEVDEGGICPCRIYWRDEDHQLPYMMCFLEDEDGDLPGPMGWSAASAFCEQSNYHLVVFDDSAEASWLYGLGLGGYKVWVGYSDEEAEGQWLWVNGSSSTHDSWCGSSPDGGTDQNCAAIDYGNCCYDDAACTDVNDFVCEPYATDP